MGTRRPPRVTEPCPAPCRDAARSGSCLPRGPHTATTSASINSCITSRPGPDREREESLTHVGGDLGHRNAHLLWHGQRVRIQRGRLILLGHSGPLYLALRS
jgi:hypothetical protein